MSTQFSLRRLSKIVKALDVLINETRDDINRSISVTVNVHDDIESIRRQVSHAGIDFEHATDRFAELLRIRTTLRLVIGAANQANGVNNLVTELQMVNTTLAFYTHLKQNGREEKLSDDNLERRVEAAKIRPETARVDFGGFGGRAHSEDSLTLVTLSEDSTEWIQESLSEAKFRSEAIVEQLERINTSIVVEIQSDVVDSLIGFAVIQDPDSVEPVLSSEVGLSDEQVPQQSA